MSSDDPTERAAPLAPPDPVNRLLAGLFVGAWALVGWWSHLRNREIIGVDFGADPGPGVLPAIALTILAGGALVLIAAGLFGLHRQGGSWPRLRDLAWRAALPLLLVASLAGYVPLVRAAGFLPANLGFAFVWMTLLTGRRLNAHPRRAFAAIAAGSVAGVGLVYALFIRWIGVPL